MIGYVSMDEYYNSPQHSVGAEPVSTATAIATSAPVIIAILKVVKEILGTKREEELGKSDDIMADASKSATTTNPDEIVMQTAPPPTPPTTAGGMSTNTMLLIGAGAVAVYLLTKKK